MTAIPNIPLNRFVVIVEETVWDVDYEKAYTIETSLTRGQRPPAQPGGLPERP